MTRLFIEIGKGWYDVDCVDGVRSNKPGSVTVYLRGGQEIVEATSETAKQIMDRRDTGFIAAPKAAS